MRASLRCVHLKVSASSSIWSTGHLHLFMLRSMAFLRSAVAHCTPERWPYMPELPEVEAARLELAGHVTGRRVEAVHAFEGENVLRPSPRAVMEALEGRVITGTGRHGKVQWVELAGTGPGVVSIHFGMGGAIRYSALHAQCAAWPPAHMKLEVVLEGGLRVAVTDSDARNLLRVQPWDSAASATAHLGLDAHTQYPSVEVFAAMLASKRPIKALLLDQSLLAGVGNYIADEARCTKRAFIPQLLLL